MARRRPVFTRPYNALLRAAEQHATIAAGPAEMIDGGHEPKSLDVTPPLAGKRRRTSPSEEVATT